jgi:hypothetical protein
MPVSSEEVKVTPPEKSSCFPAASHAVTPAGPKRMDQLTVGDLVMTSDGFRPVMYFGHADPLVSAKFYNIRTTTGVAVKATGLHDMIISDPYTGADTFKNAKSVRPGDHVWVYTNTTHRIKDTVETVFLSAEAGIFTPRTETNDIVVDGILASCDTSDMRVISSTLHSFMRSLYYFAPSAFLLLDGFARQPLQLKTTEGMTFWLPQQLALPFMRTGIFGYV